VSASTSDTNIDGGGPPSGRPDRAGRGGGLPAQEAVMRKPIISTKTRKLLCVALESGVLRFTDLGDRGHHLRVNVRGVADLYDSEENLVGTWTYRLRFGDQVPPDGQGAVLMIAVGPLEYADGHTAIVQVHEHEVFAKGDILKREFFKATCGG
jgi:hypothetical protein